MNRDLQQMAGARVVVVGDLILDRYWHGATRRISPEAPVPIVLVEQAEERVGGAANVAANVVALGGQATLVGVTGDDSDGRALEQHSRAAGITTRFVRESAYRTTVKLRVVSQHQQLVRLDFEKPACDGHGDALFELFEAELERCDVLVLSDYAKGALYQPDRFIDAARDAGVPVIVDPKARDFSRYRGASLITPNYAEFEAAAGSGVDGETLAAAAGRLIEAHALGAILVTRGDAGMTLVEHGGRVTHVQAETQDVFDVTGAGDTVCGVLASAVGSGVALVEAMHLANAAAGLVVGKFGAATVSVDEIDQALAARDGVRRGVVDESELLNRCSAARRRGERLVMTNGCFDILHAGHVNYLQSARAMGDRLIVAVNDDESVRRLKGEGRPLNPVADRMAVLAALDAVDWVVPFSASTPRDLIAAVLPEVLVKGGDYRVEDIAGGEEVIASGGRVEIVEFLPGRSTTGLLARAAAQRGDT